MDITKEKFDFVCSLGGNCMAASQLQQRGLRFFSLPFDWLYIKQNEIVLYNLIECFKNNFANFMTKNNMRFVPQKEFPENGHTDRIFYQDMATKYYFLNHFNKELDVDNEFEKVKEKIDRRIKRFLCYVNNSSRILFILTHEYYIDNQPYIDLYNFLKEFYPDKEIHIKVVQFNTNVPSFEYDNKKLTIVRIERKCNNYDFVKTNIEWQFLDNIEINLPELSKNRFSVLKIKKIKKGILCSIFASLNTIMYVKFCLFGIRLFFVIGKNRIE